MRNGAAVVIDNASGDVIALVGSENYFCARRGAGERRLGAAFRRIDPEAVHLSARARTRRDSRHDGGGRAHELSIRRRVLPAGKLQSPLLWSGSLPDCAGEFVEHSGGESAARRRWSGGVARAPASCGLTTLTRSAEIYGLGLTLGNCEGRLLELTNAYASLARLGEYRPWRVLTRAPTAARRYSRPELVWQIADIMSDNSARTLAFGMNSALRFDYPVACKTGTSTDFRDNWTIGFTPEFSVGVWVGNFDGAPMREVSGVTGAGPILHAVFDYLHAQKGTSWYRTPPEIVERNVHPLTGKLLADSDRVACAKNSSRGVCRRGVAGRL